MDENLLGQQIPIAIIASELIQWLKKQPWFPFAKFDAPQLNKVFAAIMAILTGIGLHFAFDSQANGGTLTITGLNWQSVLHSGWAAIQQFTLQHAAYWAMVKPAATDGAVKRDSEGH